MPAAEAQIAADPRPRDCDHGDPRRHRGPSSALSTHRGAAVCGLLKRTRAWTGAFSGGGSVCAPGRSRRVPRRQVGRWPERQCGGASRVWVTPDRGTDAAAIRAAAGLARRARTGR
jgi:hypothetical protein